MVSNDMSTWEAIRCQRGPHEHYVRRVTVDLGKPHGYQDLPQIPSAYRRQWRMFIWDPKAHPVDGGAYCPAHDAVSETIVSHWVWEPGETQTALRVLEGQDDAVVVDMGAQLGWFTLLALSCGATVEAWEADEDNIVLLEQSVEENRWSSRLTVIHERIGPDTHPAPASPSIRLAKLDLEGAEPDGVRVLMPAMKAGNLDFLLVELSPVFHDGYDKLAQQIIDTGYQAWALPKKQRPPRFELTPWTVDDLDPHQEVVLFQREGAEW